MSNNQTLFMGIAVGGLLMASMNGAALAGSSEDPKEMLYEFSFQYDRDQMTNRQAKQEVQKRLRQEATAYCDQITKSAKDRDMKKTCVREVILAVNQKMAKDKPSQEYLAAR